LHRPLVGAAERNERTDEVDGRQSEGLPCSTDPPGKTYLIGMVLSRERTRPGLGLIEPCLPSPAKAPPSGAGWIHEIKHDGFRIMARRFIPRRETPMRNLS
jgi:hypothetical protein